MAKHTKVKWTCPDCGSVNETMCNGSVTGGNDMSVLWK